MSLFDAIGFAFGTVSTGGYAPHEASIAFYHGDWIYIASIVFMILGGTNFSLHFIALGRMKLKTYCRDTEFRAYILIYLAVAMIATIVLLMMGTYHNWGNAFSNSVYQVVSFGTTTGFVSDMSYATWPLFLSILLLFMGIAGACAGSTIGGVKMIRLLLFAKKISRETKRLIHPNGTLPVKLGECIVPDRVMGSVWSFLSAYLGIFLLFWIILMGTGLDPTSAFSAIATCMSNAGPGLGSVSLDFYGITPFARWILTIAMLVGRLEVFTVLVLFSSAFWRH